MPPVCPCIEEGVLLGEVVNSHCGIPAPKRLGKAGLEKREG
jgi:hypothetical protein